VFWQALCIPSKKSLGKRLIIPGGDKDMKKLISTVTAVAFALGLAGVGLAQTAAQEAAKPEVKMETPAAQPEAATLEKEKAAEPAATGHQAGNQEERHSQEKGQG
jgi:hypothetical protein